MDHQRIEGDCLEVMRDLPRGHFDMLLTDPPYAMPATYYTGKIARRRWSDTSIMSGWWRTFMERVLPSMKADSTFAVFVSEGSLVALWPIMYEIAQLLQIGVWDKGSAKGMPLMRIGEFIMVGTIGKPTTKGGIPNIIRAPKIAIGNKVHPAQKPRELLMTLARHLCPDGGRVLDPFAGSFSTEAACDSLGLECTSIEWGEAFSVPDEQQEFSNIAPLLEYPL